MVVSWYDGNAEDTKMTMMMLIRCYKFELVLMRVHICTYVHTLLYHGGDHVENGDEDGNSGVMMMMKSRRQWLPQARYMGKIHFLWYLESYFGERKMFMCIWKGRISLIKVILIILNALLLSPVWYRQI